MLIDAWMSEAISWVPWFVTTSTEHESCNGAYLFLSSLKFIYDSEEVKIMSYSHSIANN